MKKFALCVAGVAAGVGVAASTQYPVLESLGFGPDANRAVVANTDVSGEDVASDSQPSAFADEALKSSESESTDVAHDASNVSADGQSKRKTSVTLSKRQMDELYTTGVFNSQGKDLPYRLLKPSKMGDGRSYPLIVFLHGAGERGLDNEAQLKHGASEFAQWTSGENRNAFILFPQCPTDGQWADHTWSATNHRMNDKPTKSMQGVLDLIDEIVINEPVDDQRIYAAGISMGGYGVLDMLARRPRMFAAGVAICGGTDSRPEVMQRLAAIPLYIVHGDADKVVDVENSRRVVAGLKKAGGNPVYVELPGVGHDSWSPTFGNKNMFDWMFTKRMGISDRSETSVAKAESKKLRKLKKDVTADVAKAPLKPASKKPTSMSTPEPTAVKPSSKDLTKATAKPAGDRAPSIPKSTDLGTRKTMVVAKPPMKEVEPQKKAAVESKLTGKWKVIEAVHSGTTISPEKLKQMSLEFSNDSLLLRQGEKTELGTVINGGERMLGDVKVREIEIKSTRKELPSIKGFYFVDEDQLNMVWGAPGDERPITMDAKDLEKAFVLKLLK